VSIKGPGGRYWMSISDGLTLAFEPIQIANENSVKNDPISFMTLAHWLSQCCLNTQKMALEAISDEEE